MGSGKTNKTVQTKNYSHTHTVLTGEQFNAQMASTKMYKVLHSNLMHYKYKYEPNALNDLSKLGETFNPDPDCQPGGLYFCSEAELFRFVHMVGQPLIVRIEIPPDARVSVSEHKYKTNKLILGQPKTFDEFYTDEYVSNLPMDIVMQCSFEYLRMWDIVKRMRTLVPNKFGNIALYHKVKLLRGAVWHNDVSFLDLMFDDVLQLLTKPPHGPKIVVHICDIFSHMPRSNDSVIGWFSTRFPQYIELVDALRFNNTV